MAHTIQKLDEEADELAMTFTNGNLKECVKGITGTLAEDERYCIAYKAIKVYAQLAECERRALMMLIENRIPNG